MSTYIPWGQAGFVQLWTVRVKLLMILVLARFTRGTLLICWYLGLAIATVQLFLFPGEFFLHCSCHIAW